MTFGPGAGHLGRVTTPSVEVFNKADVARKIVEFGVHSVDEFSELMQVNLYVTSP